MIVIAAQGFSHRFANRSTPAEIFDYLLFYVYYLGKMLNQYGYCSWIQIGKWIKQVVSGFWKR